MKLDSELKKRLIGAMADVAIGHAVELTDLDRAIGDGDHGLNMKRGFEAVAADRDNLAAKPLPDLLRALGTHLVMTIGGASGPLYGTLFMALGKEIPAEPSLADAARAFGAAVNAVKARGKSNTGEKTMLDVLQPVADVLLAAAGGASDQNIAGVQSPILDQQRGNYAAGLLQLSFNHRAGRHRVRVRLDNRVIRHQQDRFQQVIANCATHAAVGQAHHIAVDVDDQLGIDIQRTKVIDQRRNSQSVIARKQAAQQSRFAGAKKSSEHRKRHRRLPTCPIVLKIDHVGLPNQSLKSLRLTLSQSI